MLAPISWLKDFVDITIPVSELSWRLTELGLGVESVKKINGEPVLELEITPNRPDLLSIVGIAREIAAIENKKLKIKPTELPSANIKLPLKINNNYSLFSRYCGIIIDQVTIKPSPLWLQNRLILIGLRPINNIVDITNYVMFELGIPLHAFDYKEIKGQTINVLQAKGGEPFKTIDNLSYKLPKGGIIIKDSERIIDLCGIKGGLNSGIKDNTKTIYLQVTADDPLLIRRASQTLSLRSDASTIFERGVDKGGILNTLKRATKLIVDLAGGKIASEIIDLKKEEFTSWKLNLSLKRLEKILGYKIPPDEVITILSNLTLIPERKGDTITVTVPTYREDLQIEEDVIEEVARVYGYNKFPKTLINNAVPTTKIAYFKDYTPEDKIKNLLVSFGYNELCSYSLISSIQLKKLGFAFQETIRITNPVSSDFEYLRPTLIGNILTAIYENQVNFDKINIFELGKIYSGAPPDSLEPLSLVTASLNHNYRKLKGNIEELFWRLGIRSIQFIPIEKSVSSPVNSLFTSQKSAHLVSGSSIIGIIGEISSQITHNFNLVRNPNLCQIEVASLEKLTTTLYYKPQPSTPILVEDLSLLIPPKTYLGEIVSVIKESSHLIKDVKLLDSYGQTHTLRLIYQDPKKTLSTKEIKSNRHQILMLLEKKFAVKLKE